LLGDKFQLRPIYIKNYQKIYLPDNYVILGEPNSYTVKKGFAPYTNPWMIAEVITQKNVVRNWSKKLPSYKKIPTMKYILFIDEERPYVSLFIRSEKSSIWENTDYDNLKDTIKIEGISISLERIYNKIGFVEMVDS